MNAAKEKLELLLAAQQGDSDACEQMIRDNSGLIWSVARRFFGRGVDLDDLYQLGCVGFIKAVRDFDVNFGTQFSTYAVPKITGEIRRFIRDDGAVKVSRGIKDRANVIRGSREKLRNSFGRDPTVTELSEDTGIPAVEIAEVEIVCGPVESIHRELNDEGHSLEAMLGSEGIEDELVEHLALREAMSTLPEKERMVLDLRYFHGLTQQQTANVLDISQVQVSRIERKAVEALRHQLT